uniref:WD_REPEATS_REGION domain-containing protein n=1 Tax=Heligmosomoides polygyrus TaxID=6339 RepID=A0A183FJL5_HELPZ
LKYRQRINLRENTFTNLLPIKSLLPKQDEITSMIWSGQGQSEVLAALLDRQLKLYDAQTNTFNPLFKLEGGEGAVQGLHSVEGGKIVSCVESGHLSVWNDTGESCGEWQAGPGVKVMRGSNTRKEVVTGGMKNLLKTWDIETGKRVWGARNVPLDFLGLEVPIAITDARYVDDVGNIIEATKVHELRLYDPRAQRRPVKKIPFMDVPITAVSRCYRDKHVLAANSIGEMGLFDLRSKIHPVCKYKGQAGAIRSIDAHPTAPYVATCGIDRFVRVHDIDTKKLSHKVYCKTRLNRVLLRADLPSLATVIDGGDEQEWKELKRSSERKRRDEDVLAVEAVVGFSARNPWLSRAFISIRVRLYFARDDDDAACPVQISISADRPIDSQGMQAFRPRYHAHHEKCYRFSFL